MGDGTKIEWADATWNPVTGCTKVSQGCDHCYAETVARRFAGTPAYPDGFEVTLRPERLDQPLRWQRPRRVFVNSMSDLFHKDVPDEYIARVFAVMALAPRHTFQVLTKRPGRMRAFMLDACKCGQHGPMAHLRSSMMWAVSNANPDRMPGVPEDAEQQVQSAPWPLPNVWLGTSVESQKWADVRIPLLLDTPAAVRFISAEPLLGSVSIFASSRLDREDAQLDWVIVGGESGPHARPMHPRWARDLRDECVGADIPFLFKQWGEWRWAREADDRAYEDEHGDPFPAKRWWSLDVDGTLHDGPSRSGSATVQKVGKKTAGRELDGRTWDEYPTGGTEL